MFFNTGPGKRFDESTSRRSSAHARPRARDQGARPQRRRPRRHHRRHHLPDAEPAVSSARAGARSRKSRDTHLPHDAAERRRPRSRRRRRRRRSRPRARRLGPRQQHDQRRRPHAAVAERRHGPLHRRHRRRACRTCSCASRGTSSWPTSTTTTTSTCWCRASAARGSYLFRNDGAGTFTDDPRALPQYTNNYEFEPMDLDGDGFLDLVTINDGEIVNEQQREPARARVPQRRQGPLSRRDRRAGGRRDQTSARTTTWWRFSTSTPTATPTSSIGSLSGPDRLLINDGKGHLTRRARCLRWRAARPARSASRSPISTATAAWTWCRRRASIQRRSTSACSRHRPRARHGAAVDHDGARRARARRPASWCARACTIARARACDRVEARGRRVDVAATVRSATPMRWYGEYLWRADWPATSIARRLPRLRHRCRRQHGVRCASSDRLSAGQIR